MIFNENIKQQTPKTCEYFEKIFADNTSKLSPSIILYGDNAQLSYEFAKEIARALNCQKDRENSCECLNCKWIRENKHPEVNTYSNLENKKDKSKTVISIDQIHDIINEIMIVSENKRVYIFCGAQEITDKNGKKVIKHLPLNSNILKSESANALLKSIEEPPRNTYFIFITKDKNDLLPTIISRSQSFYIHSKRPDMSYLDGLQDLFNFYPCYDYTRAKDFIEKLKNWQISNDLQFTETMDYVQNYLKQMLETNINNCTLTNKITSDIIKFEKAKNMVQSSFKDYIIFEDLTYKIYKD